MSVRVGAFPRRTGAMTFALAVAASLCFNPPALAAQGGDVYSLEQLSELPRLRNNTRAAKIISDSYPNRLRRRNISGSVRLRFVVMEDGSVDESTVEIVAASVVELGDAAMSAASKLRFVPGKIDGSPVKTMVMFPIRFGSGD